MLTTAASHQRLHAEDLMMTAATAHCTRCSRPPRASWRCRIKLENSPASDNNNASDSKFAKRVASLQAKYGKLQPPAVAAAWSKHVTER